MIEPKQDITEERLTRNLNELLQELRVTQTGVQILTGFLLTVPFSNRFADLDDLQRTVYLCVLVGSVLTTAIVVAPVAFHRALFRQKERRWIVEAANRCVQGGLILMALTVSGVLFLVFDLVVGPTAATVAMIAALACFAVVWGLPPALVERKD
jgi:hypothetical protein